MAIHPRDGSMGQIFSHSPDSHLCNLKELVNLAWQPIYGMEKRPQSKHSGAQGPMKFRDPYAHLYSLM